MVQSAPDNLCFDEIKQDWRVCTCQRIGTLTRCFELKVFPSSPAIVARLEQIPLALLSVKKKGM